jgi:hypothetical protein
MRNLGFLAAACAAMLAACAGSEPADVEDVEPEQRGFVTVQWALADETDAGTCKQHNASAVELVLINTDNNQVTREVVPCQRFDMSVQVVAADYVGTLTLLDEDGKPMSKPLPVGPFEVSGTGETTRRVSFSAEAMQGE